MISDSDENLLIKIQNGDNTAFSELIHKHHKKFYYLAYRYMKNKEDSEDVVQSVFLKLWEKPYMFKNDKKVKFTTWFYRVVINFCLDQIKKKNSSLFITCKDIDNLEILDKNPSAEEHFSLHKQYNLLEIYINKLPKRQKEALILCFLENVSHKEAANIMNISIKALQSLLMRAKTNLKEKIN